MGCTASIQITENKNEDRPKKCIGSGSDENTLEKQNSDKTSATELTDTPTRISNDVVNSLEEKLSNENLARPTVLSKTRPNSLDTLFNTVAYTKQTATDNALLSCDVAKFEGDVSASESAPIDTVFRTESAVQEKGEDSITSNDTGNFVQSVVVCLEPGSSFNVVDTVIKLEEVALDKAEESIVADYSSNKVDECEEVHKDSEPSFNAIDNGVNSEQITQDKTQESTTVAESEELYQQSNSGLNVGNAANDVTESQEIQ